MLKSHATAPDLATTTAEPAATREPNLRLVASQPDGGAALPSPIPLMALSTGFWAFKTLAAAHELGLFGLLAQGRSTTAAELADALRIDPRPAEMLLTGCAALGLLEKDGGRYRNAPLSEAYLVPGKPHYFGGWIDMADKRLYAGWGKLADALRTNRPTTWDPDAAVVAVRRRGSEDARAVLGGDAFALDHDGARARPGGRFQRLSPAARHRRRLGRFRYRALPNSTAASMRRCSIFRMSRRSPAQMSRAPGLRDRIESVGGDFFGELPTGHDLHLFSMIMHDWDEAKNKDLLRRSYEALMPGGAVIISELLVDDDKTGPTPAALMSLNMLIETEGRNYTPAEYAAWLAEAGFRDIETVWFDAPGANGAVIGHKR